MGRATGAGEAGRRLGIEMVDAAKLEGVLRRLPANRGEFLWNLAFDGDAHAPTCPVCLGKLVLKDTALDHSGPAGEERGFSQDAIISEPVHCRLLRVVRGVEVQFLQQARAQEMEIEGIAHGDLVCEGTLWMGPTAEVHGTVAAVKIKDGAQMFAELSVLQAGAFPPMPAAQAQAWRCVSGDERCRGVSLYPHSAVPET